MFFDGGGTTRRRNGESSFGGWKIFGIVMAIIAAIALFIWFLFGIGACSAMNIVSWEVSREANNFGVVRELTVYNNVTGEIIMVAQGRISVVVDAGESQLEIIVANPGEQYEKHLVGLNETTTYIVRDLAGIEDVENFEYRTVINPRLMAEFEAGLVAEDEPELVSGQELELTTGEEPELVGENR